MQGLFGLHPVRLAIWLAPVLVMVPAQFGAGLDPSKAITQYRHDVWRVEEGLPQNTVPTITQGKNGYLWFGTELGLVRFDGLRFTVFDKSNTPELRSSLVRAVLEDRRGDLWIGTTGGGLSRMHEGRVKTYRTKDGLPNDSVLTLLEDRAGRVWIGTEGGGLSSFENGRFTTFTMKDGLAGNDVFALAEDKSGNLWAGTHDGLTVISNGKCKTFHAGDGIPANYVRALFVDRDGALWIGTNGGGLGKYRDGKFQTFSRKDGLPSEAIFSIKQDGAGSIWIATIGAGIARYRNGKFVSYTAKEGLSNDDAWCLYYDRDGNLWIGTGGGGLNRLMDGRITAYDTHEGLSKDETLAVFEDSKGDLWVATNRGGVNRFHDGRFTAITTKEGLADNFVFSLAEDREGALWIGTRKGLNRYKDGKVQLFTKKDGLAGDIAMAGIKDRQGRMWFGCRGGLSVFENGKFTTYTTANGLSNGNIQSLYEDRQGNIWIGTAGGGLNRFRDGRFEVFDTNHGLSSDVVMSIYQDAAGSLWVGTNGGGLNRLKDGKVTTYDTNNGLADDGVFQIIEDAGGNLWMTSNKGIFRCRLADLNRMADGGATKISSVLYDRADGMKSRECNGGFQPAGFRAHDGHLWFPTMRGVVTFDPKVLEQSEPPPTVFVEQAWINKQLAPGVIGRAEPGSGELEFRYTAINFRSANKTVFRYKLEGFDHEWIEAGARPVAYYTNIAPGTYRFRVSASNGDGVWTPSEAGLDFTLDPHWWESWWFRTLSISVFLAILAVISWWKNKAARHHREELEAMVDQRTSQLHEQVRREERARAELAKAQHHLIKLSRDSGKAEVATGILHNVGNVLTSVNVSATLLGDKTKDLRVDNLVSVVDMLQRNEGNLDEFLTNDPKGQRILPYLAKLADHFRQQRRNLLAEAELLRDRVDHIKQIVSTQQRYATVSGLIDKVSLPDLVEDAFRIIQPEFERYHIQLRRDFEPIPALAADKHNVLQILLNLLQNAVQAVRSSERREICVCIRMYGEERVRLEVHDTGIGLPPENLTRIFAQGFTTKRDGHGFGLHSGALAAQEMGGSLFAESDGPDRGATFVLELPVTSSARAGVLVPAGSGRM